MEDLCVSPLIQAVQRLDVHSVGALVAKGARVSNARIASRMPASRLVRLACDCTLVRRRHILLLHSMLAGAKQRELDCGLHEVAVGDRESANCQKARLIIAKILVAKGALPDNRQHGCGCTTRSRVATLSSSTTSCPARPTSTPPTDTACTRCTLRLSASLSSASRT